MQPIRIGIDIDGVLRNFNGRVQELAAEQGLFLPIPTEWGYLRKHHIDGESLASKIWTSEEWLEPVFGGAPVLPFGYKGYNAFVEDPSFEVYIVSSQTEESAPITDQWLKTNGFDRHVKTVYTFNKLEAPTQVLIDDKPDHIQTYQENLREGYLIKRSHNLSSTIQPTADNVWDAYQQITETTGELV